MTKFEEQLKEAAERSVLKIISDGSWIENRYDNRFTLPKELLADVYKLVNVGRLREQLAKRLEEELAERILNHMAAEISTDIKQILSVKERREALRAVVRENFDRLTAKDPQ
jgi:hypothetical protein